uniref:Uncharacterized protein n=1 Tax=Cucumis melo TaxID=3656 RepID=A0A9I9EM57_CUCME
MRGEREARRRSNRLSQNCSCQCQPELRETQKDLPKQTLILKELPRKSPLWQAIETETKNHKA